MGIAAELDARHEVIEAPPRWGKAAQTVNAGRAENLRFQRGRFINKKENRASAVLNISHPISAIALALNQRQIGPSSVNYFV